VIAARSSVVFLPTGSVPMTAPVSVSIKRPLSPRSSSARWPSLLKETSSYFSRLGKGQVVDVPSVSQPLLPPGQT
jgi:hypothetical protein